MRLVACYHCLRVVVADDDSEDVLGVVQLNGVVTYFFGYPQQSRGRRARGRDLDMVLFHQHKTADPVLELRWETKQMEPVGLGVLIDKLL